ncbi:MAG: hypothetical protein Q8M16_09445 [Pirellulaceae bacterium]|nr:hypothetical protein [Pirellulaceae bacterium]
MIRLSKNLLAISWVFCWAAIMVQAQPVPQLTALSQHAVQVGSTVPIQVVAVDQGAELHRLMFSHPEIVAKLQTEPATTADQSAQPKYGHFEVSVSPRVPPGIYEVAAVGRAGVSNPVAFLVSKHPVVSPEAAAAESTAGFAVPIGSLIWDRCRPEQKQRYHFGLTQPQSLVVTVEAQSLDSNAIPVVILRDEQGMELARSRAIKRLPAEIHYAAADVGNYMIEVHDFLHQGGPDFYFTLEVHVDSVATTPVTTTDSASATSSTGTEAEPNAAVTTPPSGTMADSLLRSVDVRQQMFRDPTIVPALGDWATRAGGLDLSCLAPLPTVETVHALPIILSGQFGEPSQPARIDFQGVAGQGIWCEVVSASAGQLTDPQMLLYRVRRDEAGTESLQLLTHQDDPPGVGTGPVTIAGSDPAFMATLPEEGRYCVLVMDHITSPRPTDTRQFVVSIGSPQPDFQLIAHPLFHNNDPAQARPSGSQVDRGGTLGWHVHVLRRQGFAGAIELTVAGLPEGVSASPVVVHPSIQQAMIVVQAEKDAAEWCEEIRIVGRALSEPSLRRVAWPATIQHASSPRRNFIQWSLVAQQRLRVGVEQEAALGMNWASHSIAVTPNVATTAVLDLERRTGGGGQCVVRPVALPPGWTIGEVTVPPDQTQANIAIQVPAETPAGRYTLSFHNETKIQWKPTAEAAPQEVQVWLPVPTLTIEVAPQ